MKATVRAGRAMGSPLRLTLAGAREREADTAWAIVARTFAAAESDLSRFDATSSLSHLNRAVGTACPVPRRLGVAVALAWRAFRVTRGRFDPRIIGALEAAGERAGVTLPPSPARLEPGDRWLWLDTRRGLARVDAPIDLGGIGKGLALRWAARNLSRAGVEDFLLQAGGDLVARGRGLAARPWLVRIAAPPHAGSEGVTIELRDEAVATSSAAVRRWTGTDGRSRHHLIDPGSGQPADDAWWSVTVRAADPAWAEVASKVGFLAGARIREALGPSARWWVIEHPAAAPYSSSSTVRTRPPAIRYPPKASSHSITG